MFEPRNEIETILLFDRQFRGRFKITSITPSSFPDAVVLDVSSGKQYYAEFEFMASSFMEHEHDPFGCDLIICWKNDLDKTIAFPVWEVSTQTFGEVFAPSTIERENFALKIENKMLKRQERREKKKSKQEVEVEVPKDWRKVRPTLSANDVTSIARAQTGWIMETYHLSEKTARNWRSYAEDELEVMGANGQGDQ